MSFEAGTVLGHLKLDKSQFTSPLQQAATEAKSASAAMRASLEKPFGPAAAELRKLSSSIADASSKTNAFKSAMGSIQSALQPIGLIPGQFGAVASRLQSLGGVLSSVASNFASAGAGASVSAGAIAAMGAAAAVALVPLSGFAAIQAALHSDAVRLAADLEVTTAGFATMLKSLSSAQALLSDLRKFANDTPFEFPEVAQTARSLLNAGVSVSQLTAQLKLLGDVASGSQTDLTGLAAIYTQVANKGKADTMDLMQFANRGLPIYAALAAALNVSRGELSALVESGRIGFPQIQAAFSSMVSETGAYHDAMKNAQGTLKQLQSTANDTWRAMEEAIGKVLIDGLELKKWLQDQTDLLQRITPIVTEMFKKGLVYARPFLDALKWTMDTIGSIGKAISEFTAIIHERFGAIGDVILGAFNPLNYVSFIVKAIAGGIGTIAAGMSALASLLEKIRKGLEAVNWLGSDERTKMEINNAQAVTKAQIEELKKQKKARQDAKAEADKAAGKTPTTGSSAGKPSNAAPQSGTTDVDQVAQMALETRLAQLRAAGKEDEAALEEFDARWSAKWKGLKSEAERRQADSSYSIERNIIELAQQREADQKSLDASQAAIDDAMGLRIAQFRASGEQMQADLWALLQQARKDYRSAEGIDAKETVNVKYRTDEAAIRSKYAEEAKKTMEAEGDARNDLIAARLQEQGRAFEAELFQFDAMWQKKIAAAKTAQERITLQETYESERRQRVAKEESDARQAMFDRLKPLLDQGAQLRGQDRKDYYAAIRREIPNITDAAKPYTNPAKPPESAADRAAKAASEAITSASDKQSNAITKSISDLRATVAELKKDVSMINITTLNSMLRSLRSVSVEIIGSSVTRRPPPAPRLSRRADRSWETLANLSRLRWQG